MLHEDDPRFNARASQLWSNAEKFDWRAEWVFRNIQARVTVCRAEAAATAAAAAVRMHVPGRAASTAAR
jgi:hypothetical protein